MLECSKILMSFRIRWNSFLDQNFYRLICFVHLGKRVVRKRSAIRLQPCLRCSTRATSNQWCRRLRAWDHRQLQSEWLSARSPVWWSIATNRATIFQRTRHFTRRIEALFGDQQTCKNILISNINVFTLRGKKKFNSRNRIWKCRKV